MLKVLSQKARRGTPSLAWKLALLNLVRHPLATLSSFLAIGLAVLMMALIPQIRDMMVNEIAFPPGQIPPGLFLFDIQDDQIEPLRAVLKSENLPLNHLSPLARVTLSSINGKKLQRYDPRLRPSDKEARRQARIRSLRRYNASSRSHLARSENLIQGRLFKGRYNWDNSPAEISLAEDTATHLGVTPGDTLGFELQGVEFEAILVGIRKVQWTSFEPNFHLLFQPGVLDDAPKSWLATLPELPLTRRVAVQRRLLADFPNLAMVDISGMVNRLVTIVDQLLRVIGLMALVTLAAGFSVLFSIANYQSQERAPDLALLKTLGTQFDIIRHSVMLEFLLLSSLAAGVGTLLSFGVSFALGQYIFQFNWQIQPLWPLGTLIMTIVLGTLIGLLGTGPVLKISPQYFLQERGV